MPGKARHDSMIWHVCPGSDARAEDAGPLRSLGQQRPSSVGSSRDQGNEAGRASGRSAWDQV